MAIERKDRIKDTSTVFGTGTATLIGDPIVGYRVFSGNVTNLSTVRYLIENADGSEWEVGEGIYTSSGNTLSRNTIFASSNSGAIVDFSSGTKSVSVVITAADFSGGIAEDIHAATEKTTPSDADELGLIDSAASYVLKRLTWTNVKATLKTYFDTLYQPIVRTNTITSHATPSINVGTTDIFTITALAEAITSMTTNLTGTPVNGQKLTIRIKDNGTARAITWGASFASRGATLPTTTVLGKYLYVGFIYNSTASVWDCVCYSKEA